MAAGDVLGTRKCSRCDGLVTYKETKQGAISGVCGGCGRQSFDRSPKAVDGLKRRIAGAGSSSAAGAGAAAANDDTFDLTKL
jgi:predicted  nucleic acid-binding Zn-ribbon protein